MAPMIDIKATLGNPTTWLGYQRLMDAIGKGEALHTVLLDLGRHYKTSEAVNFDLFNGGLMCLLDAWSSLVSAGTTVTNGDKRIEGFLNGSRARLLCDLRQAEASNPELFALLIWALCDCVHQTRQRIRFTVTQPAPAAESPLAVRIVSAPSTVSVQEVVRDTNDEILRTVTTTKSVNSAA